jgi:hypothetical protein
MVSKNNQTILFRKDLATESEYIIAKKYFNVSESRMGLTNQLVIPRYSALPFYKELETDIIHQGSALINNYRGHKYIANFDYYWDIHNFTPKTYFKLEYLRDKGPYIVKGVTNSKKFLWKELMFAETKIDAIKIAIKLQKDSMISQQDIIVRDYVPLEKVSTGFHGLPISNEWRFFIFNNKILSYGFYWANIEEELWPKFDPECLKVVYKTINRIISKHRFCLT